MGVKEIYFALEDRYYAGLDWLDHHGMPVYKVVDAIEAQNVPSFPIAAFALLLVVGGLFVLASGGLGGGTSLSVLVQDDTQTPLSGISVQLSGDGLSGEALTPRLTDSTGMVAFSNLPPGTMVHITAAGEGYSIPPASVVLDAGENPYTLSGQVTLATKSILLHLYKAGTNESFAQAVALQFACSGNPAFAPASTITNGQIALDVPGDCGTLTASSSDPGIQLENSTIDVEANQPSLGVKITPTGNAVLRVTLLDESGSGISGLTTILKSKFGDQLAQKFTDGSGFVQFDGLVPDTYTIFTPADGTNGEFDSGPFEVSDGSPVDKTFTVQAASVGEIRLQLVDEGSLAPVAGAKVTLSKGNQSLFTKTSNDGGQVTFTVSSTNNLNVSIDHPSYLVKSGVAVAVSSAGFASIPMTKATLQNSQIVTVNVIDELGLPVEGAYVALKKSPSGASVGTNKITGASGTVLFSSLEEGTYFASAYKPGFSDQLRSDIFTVKARENVQVPVKLILGNGTLSFVVQGFDGQPLAGATIQPVDAGTQTSIGSEITTGVDGSTELTLRADKFAYFVVSEPNHLPFVTIPVQVKKGLTQSVSVELVKDIQKLEIKPLGTFVNGTPVLEESGLAPGQTYTVRFGLYVPKNSVFSETGVHIRTGVSTDGQTNPIENDDWSIRAVRGAFSKIQEGTTYTPPAGLGIDAQHLTSADAKWTNAIFAPMHEGLTIVEVDVTVKDTAVQGADLPLYYRAWGKTGSYVRFPVDAVLGGSESVAEKQGLYANANLKLYSTGAGTHLCNKDFCLGMVAEDLSTRLQTPLTTDYTADVGTKHKLLFTFTSISDNVFADTSLILQSSGGSANLQAYEVTNAVGAKKGGNVSGNKVEIPLGSIQKNNVVFGFVNADAGKEGSAHVKLSLVSNKKELFARELLIKVNAAGVMNVEVVPKAILPLLVNQLLVHVTQAGGSDEIPLEDASVSVKLNATLLTSGFTDTEGVFPFELHEPNVNDEVTLRVEKPGYSPVNKIIRVGSDVVGFVPEQVNETLVVNGSAKKTRDVRAFNLASVPLTIDEITLSGDFEGLVKFDLLNDEIIGNILGVNGDQNITFALSLTEKGQKLLNPRTLKGSLIVKVDTDAAKTFVNTLPVNVKIGFGGEVDNEKCLLIDPAAWNIFSDPSQSKQRAVELTNTCTVKGVPVKLNKLSAKIKQGTGDPIGAFAASAGSASVELGSEYKIVLDEIPAGETITVNVGFVPNTIESGTASPQIVFQATNLTDNGVPDLLTATVQTNIIVNALAKCVQVNAPTPAAIDSCPINTGMGQYSNYFGQVYQPTGVPYYNPNYAVLNKTTNPSGSSLLPSSVSGGFGSFYGTGPVPGVFGASGFDGLGGYSPNAGAFTPGMAGGYSSAQGYYGNPSVDRYNYSGGAGNQFGGCGTTEIRIENSCQSPVEIQLDADPNLYASANAFVLQPNQNQRVRIAAGYRIGKYSVAVNAHVAGSQEPSKEVSLVSVLIKSPTEVNADCITLNKSTFRFNDFIQKPITGKVINRCYDSGVRLVPSADTITIASYFNGPAEVTPTPKGSTTSAKNSMVKDIQLIGVTTEGSGSDTIQSLEFQIFPDFQQYKRVSDPFAGNGGIGQQLSDLKFFAEGQFYRAESYGTISVKYLDPYGGSQQKPFPVIFEDLWNIAGILDIGDGNPAITRFQDCINPDALQFRNTGSNLQSTSAPVPLEFSVDDLTQDRLAVYVTTTPNEVLFTGDAFCGGNDYLRDLTTSELSAADNSSVKATFQIVGKRNIQVTVNIPETLANDVVIAGTLKLSLTRTAVNAGTQSVSVPVKITVKHGTAKSPNNYALLACTAQGYENGGGFSTTYGFDKIKLDWTYEGSPSCGKGFCDATQFTIDLARNVKKFNSFIRANQSEGLFSAPGVTYTTSNFIKYVNETIGPVKDDTASGNPSYTFFQSAGGNSVVDLPPSTIGKSLLTNTFKSATNGLALDQTYVNDPQGYINAVKTRLESVSSNAAGKGPMATLVIVLEKKKLGTAEIAVVEAAHADKVTFADKQERYIWTYNEFKEFNDKLFTYAKNNTGATNAPLGIFAPNTMGLLSADNLKTIYSSIQDVVPAYPVPTNDADLDKLKSEDIAYLLAHAKQKGLVYGDYGTNEGLRNGFIDTKAYLLPDSFSPAFFTDLLSVNGDGYTYKESFDAGTNAGTPNLVADAIKTTTFKNGSANSQTFKITHPGLYNLRLSAKWTSGKDGIAPDTLSVEIPQDEASFQTLTEMDEETAGSATPTHYAENPFLYLPLNGKTQSSAGAPARNGYGVGVALSSASGNGKVKYTNKPAALSTTISGGAGALAVNVHTTLSEIASFVNRDESGLPEMFRLTRAGNNFNMDYAPSIPVPLKLTFNNPAGLASFQYGIRAGAQTTAYENLGVSSPILWKDCTTKTGKLVSVNPSASCDSSQVNDQSLTPSGAGNAFTYTGIALVPANSAYFIDAKCAVATATLKGAGGANSDVTVDNKQNTQIEGFALQNAAAGTNVKNLQDMLDAIAARTACGSVANGTMSIIWDASKITPPALTCAGK